MNLNERNQQILGLLSLAGGAANRLFADTPKVKSAQEQYKSTSDSVRVSLRKFGIQKPSMTYVGLHAVPRMFSVGNRVPDAVELMRQVTLRAERVNQPGIQIATSNVRRYGVGPTEKKPFTSVTNDVNISFIGDSGGVIHQFFYTWLNGVVGSYSLPSGGGQLDIFNKSPFEVEYKDNYKTVIDIITYDEIQNYAGMVRLHNAFPIALGEIQRDWAGVNDLVRVPVTFAYSHWTYEGEILKIVEPSRETLASQKTSMFDSVLKGMTAIQALSSIKRPQNVNDVLNVVNSGSTLLSSFLPSSNFTY